MPTKFVWRVEYEDSETHGDKLAQWSSVLLLVKQKFAHLVKIFTTF
jgi:hypothetical protein